MQHQLVTTSPARPSRAQIEPAALELLSRHSAGLLATARKYSASPEDAEDAYQRGVEILLTKAPTTHEAELLPWLRTVVKHEAFAVRKSSGRVAIADDEEIAALDASAWTDDQAECYERLRVGAEAMSGLKPHEIRCLLLKAEGLSYQEICEATGWTYTKVNRCITEGRKAFLNRVARIESGAECERLAPLISKAADGEASAEEMRSVRPHLKGCLACKATLREYRAAPTRLAGLVPPVVALAGGGGKVGLLGRLLDRFGGMGDAAGAKVAAVAAAGVVLAGGSAAGIDALHHDAPSVPASAYAQSADPRPSVDPVAAAPTSPPAAAAPDPSAAAIEAVQNPAPQSTSSTTADPKPEFDPGTAAGTKDGSGTQAASGFDPSIGSGAPASSTPSGPAPSTSAPPTSTPSAPTGSQPGSGSGSGSGTAEFGP